MLKPRHTTRQQWEDGLHLIMWGFFKKVFLADNLAPIADQVFSKPDPTGGEVLVGVLAVSPAGSVPTTDHVYGPVPPLAVSV